MFFVFFSVYPLSSRSSTRPRASSYSVSPSHTSLPLLLLFLQPGLSSSFHTQKAQLQSLTPAEFPIPLSSVGQALVPLVVSFHGPQITAGCLHARLPHWAAGSQEQGLNSAICPELCFVHGRGSINIY